MPPLDPGIECSQHLRQRRPFPPTAPYAASSSPPQNSRRPTHAEQRIATAHRISVSRVICNPICP